MNEEWENSMHAFEKKEKTGCVKEEKRRGGSVLTY